MRSPHQAAAIGIACLGAAFPASGSSSESSDMLVPQISITSDAPVVAGGPATLRFRIEDPRSALAAGDTVEIRFPSCAPWPHTRWMKPQVDDASSPGFVSVGGPAHAEVADFPSVSLCRGNLAPLESKHQPKVIRVVIEAPPGPGEVIELVYGEPGESGRGRARAQRFPELAAAWLPFFRCSSERREPARNAVIALPPLTLAIGRATPDRTYLSGPVEAKGGETFEVSVALLDSLGFPALPVDEVVRLRALDESGKELGPWLADRPGRDPSVRIAHVRFDEPAFYWIEVVHEAGGRPRSAAWALPIRIGDSPRAHVASKVPARPRLVFGDLHWHSNRSDGSRSPREGYEYARDVVGLDFTAATDHDTHSGYPCIEDEAWTEVEALAQEMEDPGHFAALVGWEHTLGVGHWVVVHRGGSGPYRPASRFSTPELLWNALVPGESITITAHPAGGGVVPFMTAKHLDTRFVRATEIFSSHGAAESPEEAHAPMRRGKRSEGATVRGTVQEMFSRGNRFAVLAATDNHTATPGNPIRHTRRDIASGTGLCAAWVDSLTREGVFDAVHRGDVYATTGPRIRVEMQLEAEEIVGLVAGSSKLTSVDIVGVRKGSDIPFPYVHSIPAGERLVRFRWEPADSLHAEFDGVYLRVVQDDGEMAWSSPVWFPRNGEERRS